MATPPKLTCYWDFGSSFGTNIWKFITGYWPGPPYVNLTATTKDTPPKLKMDVYLASLFAQMKAAGQTTIVLSFAQLDNITYYASQDYSTASCTVPAPIDPPCVDTAYDTVASLLNQLQTYSEGNTVKPIKVPGFKDFLDYFNQRAIAAGMQVILSFGGAVATDSQFKILQNDSDTYVGAANNLVKAIKLYNFAGIDFDIEDSTALSSQSDDASGGTVFDFFKTIYSQLGSTHVVSLTSAAGHSWRTTLSEFLSNFNSYFNALNLMTYSDTQYYLDVDTICAPTDGYSIQEWVDAIGAKNTSMIHIGFDDGIHYAQASANAGQCTYSIKAGSTDGQAAAQIWQQISAKIPGLGDPFWWPAHPKGDTRYIPTTSSESNFITPVMQDFYNTLSATTLSGGLSSKHGRKIGSHKMSFFSRLINFIKRLLKRLFEK